MAVSLNNIQKQRARELANSLFEVMKGGVEALDADPPGFEKRCKPFLTAVQDLPEESDAYRFVRDAAVALLLAYRTLAAATFYDLEQAVKVDRMGGEMFRIWKDNPNLVEQAVRQRKDDVVTKVIEDLFSDAILLAMSAKNEADA